MTPNDSHRFEHRRRSARWCGLIGLTLASLAANAGADTDPIHGQGRLLIAIGDSLTHGTMNGTNNQVNTLNGYLQRVAEQLAAEQPLRFAQPLFSIEGERIDPTLVPTNLGVDGADSFTAEGYRYYKRAGVEESYIDPEYVCAATWPAQLDARYEKVIYPLNLLARAPATQIDGVEQLLQRNAAPGNGPSAVIYWLGNNDSSLASLGWGGLHPTYVPIPFRQIAPELDPQLSALLAAAESVGELSFEPYRRQTLLNNLTDLDDLTAQANHLLDRIAATPRGAGRDVFVVSLPYYSAVAYLMDADDIEFFMRKLAPDYQLPSSFARVRAGEPFSGDRVSLFTWGMMYALLSTGATLDKVNSVLEVNGRQADGLVMSEAESALIRERIDGFNGALAQAAQAHGPDFHFVDIGGYINTVFSGDSSVYVGGDEITRRWGRGGAFSLDGVHPGYTAQALIANEMLAAMAQLWGGVDGRADLEAIHASDPYADHDGDGWVSGPDYPGYGVTDLLYMFLDPDDSDPQQQASLPDDVWARISAALLAEIL